MNEETTRSGEVIFRHNTTQERCFGETKPKEVWILTWEYLDFSFCATNPSTFLTDKKSAQLRPQIDIAGTWIYDTNKPTVDGDILLNGPTPKDWQFLLKMHWPQSRMNDRCRSGGFVPHRPTSLGLRTDRLPHLDDQFVFACACNHTVQGKHGP